MKRCRGITSVWLGPAVLTWKSENFLEKLFILLQLVCKINFHSPSISKIKPWFWCDWNAHLEFLSNLTFTFTFALTDLQLPLRLPRLNSWMPPWSWDRYSSYCLMYYLYETNFRGPGGNFDEDSRIRGVLGSIPWGIAEWKRSWTSRIEGGGIPRAIPK